MTLEQFLVCQTHKTGYDHSIDRLNETEQTRLEELFTKADVKNRRFLSKRNLSEDEKEELNEIMSRFRRFKP